MLDMPILKFEKSKIYLDSQLQIQQNNKQLILDIIANIGSILNDTSTDKKDYFESILESANVFLQTITSNITMIEQLDIEIKNITKELNTLLSDKSRTKEYYIAAFTNLKQTIIVYSKKFSEIEKKLSFDNTNFNNFITVNNFKYNFESVENDNTYKFTGFTINDNEINVNSNNSNIDSIKVENEPTQNIEMESIEIENIDNTIIDNSADNISIPCDNSVDTVSTDNIPDEQTNISKNDTLNASDIIISEDDLLEEILLDSENDLEESLFDTTNIEETDSLSTTENNSDSETELLDNTIFNDDIVITENDLIEELLISSSDITIPETNTEEIPTVEAETPDISEDLIISEDDLIDELLNTTSNEDTFLDLDLTNEVVLDFENDNLVNYENDISDIDNTNLQENNEISDNDLLEELLSNDSLDNELLDLAVDEPENVVLEEVSSNNYIQLENLNNFNDILLEDLSINDILNFDDEKDDENYSHVLENLDFYINTSSDDIDTTSEDDLSTDLNFDDIIDLSLFDSKNELDSIDDIVDSENEVDSTDNIIDNENEVDLVDNIVNNENEIDSIDNIVDNENEVDSTDNIIDNENEFDLIDNIADNEENLLDNTNITESANESIIDETNQNEIFEVEDPFVEDTIPVYSETSKIDELTSEFKTLLLDLSNNSISTDSTATALISMLNQALGNTQNSIEAHTISQALENNIVTQTEEIDYEKTLELETENDIEYLNNLSVTHIDMQNVFKDRLLQNMNLSEIDICDDNSPPLDNFALDETEIITNEVQTTLEIPPTQDIIDNELLENLILEDIITNDVIYTDEEITSFNFETESKQVDYYNIDKEVIESIMNDLNTDKNFIEESENKGTGAKSFSSYSDLYNNIYMTSKKSENKTELAGDNLPTSPEEPPIEPTIDESNNTSEPQNNENVVVTPDISSNTIKETNVTNEIAQKTPPSENTEINNNTTLTPTTEEVPLEISIPVIEINTPVQVANVTPSTNTEIALETKETFPSISLETSPINEENKVEVNLYNNLKVENTSVNTIATNTVENIVDEIDIESEIEANLVDELILSTNDIKEDVITEDSESTPPPVTIPKETCSEKIAKIEKALEDNETLLISERTKKIYLPYKLFELQNYITSYPDAYTSLEDVVSKEFILPLDYFSAHPKKSRFSESYNLLRNREGRKMFKAFSYALGISQKTSLNPAIIASCKSKQELDHYIICMESNTLENFQNFNIIYEVNPSKR